MRKFRLIFILTSPTVIYFTYKLEKLLDPFDFMFAYLETLTGKNLKHLFQYSKGNKQASWPPTSKQFLQKLNSPSMLKNENDYDTRIRRNSQLILSP